MEDIHQEIEHILKHQKLKRNLKDCDRRSEETSTRSQHIGSEENDVSQKLKVDLIRLYEHHQTQKTPLDLEDLQTPEEPEGPKLHVKFIVFYGCLQQRILAQFCLLLTTCWNRQRIQGQ